MNATTTSASNPRPSKTRRRFLLLGCVMVLLWLAAGCNSYPLLGLEPAPYLEITDTLKRNKSTAVDILFVVDNSQSMAQEQEKLARNFKAFIEELTKKDVGNYQIGIISTDMVAPGHRGKLQHKQNQPKIISRAKLSAPAVIQAFQANINLGTGGEPIESPLSAMRAALSPKLLGDANGNKGFLRPGALLAVIFVADEDDCSHDGLIPDGSELGTCKIPSSQVLKNEDGSPVLDASGKPIPGVLDKIPPVSTYVKFLKSLKRDVIVAGLIGNPHVYRDTKARKPVDPAGGCQKDLECGWQGQSHVCSYNSANTRRCGGCANGIDPKTGKKDQDAEPGFRLYELIKAFGGSDDWFPICGDDDGFRNALLRFAGTIETRLKFVPLTRKPQEMGAMSVSVVHPDGRKPTLIPQAKPTTRTCQSDSICGGTFVCGQDGKCQGDGWVYFLINDKAQIKLSGNATLIAAPGTVVQVNYVAETKPN